MGFTVICDSVNPRTHPIYNCLQHAAFINITNGFPLIRNANTIFFPYSYSLCTGKLQLEGGFILLVENWEPLTLKIPNRFFCHFTTESTVAGLVGSQEMPKEKVYLVVLKVGVTPTYAKGHEEQPRGFSERIFE